MTSHSYLDSAVTPNPTSHSCAGSAVTLNPTSVSDAPSKPACEICGHEATAVCAEGERSCGKLLCHTHAFRGVTPHFQLTDYVKTSYTTWEAGKMVNKETMTLKHGHRVVSFAALTGKQIRAHITARKHSLAIAAQLVQ